MYIPYFKEAVIIPNKYADHLYNKLLKNKNKIVGNNLSIQKLCTYLSLLFISYKIIFVEDKEDSPDYFINKEMLMEDDLYIAIKCNDSLLYIEQREEYFDMFAKEFRETVGHELIHRMKFIKINNDKIIHDIFEKYKKIKKDLKKYFSDTNEIMAYAWQIIEAFRYKGLTNDQIKSMLKSNNNDKLIVSVVLNEYHKLFTIEDITLKRLYKYMYEYLT